MSFNPSSGNVTLIELGITSIHSYNNLLNRIKLYPTIISSDLTIENENDFDIEFILSSITGRQVSESQSVGSHQIFKSDISNLSPGVYFISIQNKNGNEKFFKKIIKE